MFPRGSVRISSELGLGVVPESFPVLMLQLRKLEGEEGDENTTGNYRL